MERINEQELFKKILKIEKVDIKKINFDLISDRKLLFTIADTIPVYSVSNSNSFVIACITLNTETGKPFIITDSLFKKLSVKAKTFVLYHELGHFQNGDFISEIEKPKLFDRILKRYPEREILADYYAVSKMNSYDDAISSLNEIHKIIKDSVSKSKDIYTKLYKDEDKKTINKYKKYIKYLNSSFNKRLKGLEDMFYNGPYFIDKESKGNYYDDILESLKNNEEQLDIFNKIDNKEII